MAHTNLINGINLMPTNSLVHLLDSNDTDDNNKVPIIKHSAYYGENDFSSMLANKADNDNDNDNEYDLLNINFIQLVNYF